MLFTLFIYDLNDEKECSLSKFADDAKLEAVADRPDDYTMIQRDLNRLENWMQSSLMKFNKGDSKPSV